MTISQQLKEIMDLVPKWKKKEMGLIISQVEKMERWDAMQAPILDRAEAAALHPEDFVRWLKRGKGLSGIWEEKNGMRISISIGDDK